LTSRPLLSGYRPRVSGVSQRYHPVLLLAHCDPMMSPCCHDEPPYCHGAATVRPVGGECSTLQFDKQAPFEWVPAESEWGVTTLSPSPPLDSLPSNDVTMLPRCLTSSPGSPVTLRDMARDWGRNRNR
jgi:hypothetical protein